MIRKNILCLALLTAFAAAGAGAAEKGTHDKPAIRPVGSGQQRQIDKIASEFDVTRAEVIDLRDQGLGWGEVRQALSLARKTGKPTSEIMRMRQDGMGWGEIARQEGVKLGPADKGSAPRPDRSDKGMMGGDRGNRRAK